MTGGPHEGGSWLGPELARRRLSLWRASGGALAARLAGRRTPASVAAATRLAPRRETPVPPEPAPAPPQAPGMTDAATRWLFHGELPHGLEPFLGGPAETAPSHRSHPRGIVRRGRVEEGPAVARSSTAPSALSAEPTPADPQGPVHQPARQPEPRPSDPPDPLDPPRAVARLRGERPSSASTPLQRRDEAADGTPPAAEAPPRSSPNVEGRHEAADASSPRPRRARTSRLSRAPASEPHKAVARERSDGAGVETPSTTAPPPHAAAPADPGPEARQGSGARRDAARPLQRTPQVSDETIASGRGAVARAPTGRETTTSEPSAGAGPEVAEEPTGAEPRPDESGPGAGPRPPGHPSPRVMARTPDDTLAKRPEATRSASRREGPPRARRGTARERTSSGGEAVDPTPPGDADAGGGPAPVARTERKDSAVAQRPPDTHTEPNRGSVSAGAGEEPSTEPVRRDIVARTSTHDQTPPSQQPPEAKHQEVIARTQSETVPSRPSSGDERLGVETAATSEPTPARGAESASDPPSPRALARAPATSETPSADPASSTPAERQREPPPTRPATARGRRLAGLRGIGAPGTSEGEPRSRPRVAREGRAEDPGRVRPAVRSAGRRHRARARRRAAVDGDGSARRSPLRRARVRPRDHTDSAAHRNRAPRRRRSHVHPRRNAAEPVTLGSQAP